jgi:hypothetical protein
VIVCDAKKKYLTGEKISGERLTGTNIKKNEHRDAEDTEKQTRRKMPKKTYFFTSAAVSHW